MANFTQTISGWEPWRRLPTRIDGVAKTDAPLPPDYTPAAAFWMQSLAIHCDYTWFVPIDFFSAFFLGGGGTFTLVGALSGLALAEQLASITSFGFFGWELQYPGPQTGYCINSLFKQHTYIRFTVLNDPLIQNIIIPSSYPELIQNSKSRRLYVSHGSVVNYNVETDDDDSVYVLTLDIDESRSAENVDFNGDRIQITNAIEEGSGEEVNVFTVDILEIRSNWDIVISNPGDDNTINTGDFYQLSDPWCIDDPYLLSGSWRGKESDNDSSESGYDLFVTTHNRPYVEGVFTGVYLYKNVDEDTVSSFVPGSPFKSSIDQSGFFEWTFYPLEDYDAGRYSSTTRYQEYDKLEIDYESDGTDETTVPEGDSRFDPFEEATSFDYDILTGSENLEVIRLELSSLGSTARQNFYYDNLTGQYIKVDNQYYKILAQITADVIDVQRLSVDKTTFIDPLNFKDYSILNHKGWFISEHYDGDDDDATRGVFNGTTSGISYSSSDSNTSLTLNVESDSSISWRDYDAFTDPNLPINNYIYRYRDTYPEDSPKQVFTKFNGWKIIFPNASSEFEISSMEFVDPPESYNEALEGYEISIIANGDLSSLSGQRAYLSFDDTFETYGPFSKENGYFWDMEYTAAASGSNLGLFVADQLCMYGTFRSAPYSLNIPSNARGSVCAGFRFGLEADGSSGNIRDGAFLITVPAGARGIASLFHTLRHEGWLAYIDPNTRKLTIRRGSLDYTEYPIKSEVAIGKSESVENVEVNEDVITLNDEKDRLRRLSFTLPEAERVGDPLFFGIGGADNTYGFIISGEGLLNLKTFEYDGFAAGDIPSDTYQTTEGQIVSPVYVYKTGDKNLLGTIDVDIAVDIDEGNTEIYVVNGNVSDVSAEYVNENQTLTDPGLYDMIRVEDSEILLIYGDNNVANDFTVSGISNSTTNWSSDKGVMIIGTPVNNFHWGTPLKKSFETDYEYGDWQYPIMVLNNVEYYSSIYNPMSNTLTLFVRFEDGNNVHIGAYTLSLKSLLHQVYLAESEDDDDLPFLWRPPLIDEDIINDVDRSWLVEGAEIEDGYSYDSTTAKYPTDYYTRVLGSEDNGANVEFIGELSSLFTTMMPDGTYMLMYDGADGVKTVFSMDNGRTWYGSDVIVSREGRSGILIGHYLLYVTPEGIEVKHTSWQDLYQLRGIAQKKQAGEDVESLEENIQERFDRMEQNLVGSTEIASQRISGYITPEGIMKVFYYGIENELMSMESRNVKDWQMTNNF